VKHLILTATLFVAIVAMVCGCASTPAKPDEPAGKQITANECDPVAKPAVVDGKFKCECPDKSKVDMGVVCPEPPPPPPANKEIAPNACDSKAKPAIVDGKFACECPDKKVVGIGTACPEPPPPPKKVVAPNACDDVAKPAVVDGKFKCECPDKSKVDMGVACPEVKVPPPASPPVKTEPLLPAKIEPLPLVPASPAAVNVPPPPPKKVNCPDGQTEYDEGKDPLTACPTVTCTGGKKTPIGQACPKGEGFLDDNGKYPLDVYVRLIEAKASFKMVPKRDGAEPTDIVPAMGFQYGTKAWMRIYIREDALEAFEKMASAAEIEGVHLYLNDAFRAEADQKAEYKRDKTKAEVPGFSQHETGVAADLYGVHKNTFEYLWLLKNAYRFGFSASYDSEEKAQKKGTAVKKVEPWHWVYAGPKAALHYYMAYKAANEAMIAELEGKKQVLEHVLALPPADKK